MSFLTTLLQSLFGARKPALIPTPPQPTPVSTDPSVIPDQPTASALPMLDLMTVSFKESPNKSERNDIVRAIVLHHTGPGTFDGIVNWLTNSASKVSAHYVVGQKGEIKQLVNTKKAAWHVGPGKAFLDGQMRFNMNSCTIGIEICNTGLLHKHDDDGKFYYEVGETTKEWSGAAPLEGSIVYPSGTVLKGYYAPYPPIQKERVAELCRALIAKYPQIGRDDILTHFGTSQPEGRKNDPFGLDIEEMKKLIFGS